MSFVRPLISIFICINILVHTSIAFANSELSIIYISSIPEIAQENSASGLPELATLLKQRKETNPDTLFFHGGDSLGPSMLSSFDRGAHMIDLLNMIGTNVMAVSKREFSYHEDEFILRTSEAEFPITSSNIFDPLAQGNLEGVLDYVILESGSYKLGVTSLLSKELFSTYLPKRVQLLDDKSVLPKISQQLRSEGAEFVILMIDYETVLIKQWLQEGLVDLVLINSDQEQEYITKVNEGFMISLDKFEDNAIEIKLTRNPDKGIKVNVDKVRLSQFSADEEIQTQINQHLSLLSELLENEIGTFTDAMDTRIQIIRTGENQFANMIADAIKETYKVDIGFINSGSIRGNRQYVTGEPISKKTIHRELPYRNTVSILDVTGKQVREALENGYTEIETAAGRYPQYSGMVVTIDRSAKAGNRVHSVLVNGTPLDDKATYRLATTTFLANGGDGYTSFGDAKPSRELIGTQIIADVVTDYITKHKRISNSNEQRQKFINK